MKEVPSPSPSPEGTDTPERGLRLHQLSFLGNGPFSLAVPPGRCIGITGRSGVGKTQLLRAVVDVIAHGGDCFLDGNSCSSVPAPQWRKIVSMLPAESFWWHDTVAPHFATGIQEKQTMGWLHQLGFTCDIGNWCISRLSTGERQRLSLVRTLALQPRVLLLDEPTSSLDLKMVTVVEEIVAELRRKRNLICLWVSHDLAQLDRVAERIVRVEAHGFEEDSE